MRRQCVVQEIAALPPLRQAKIIGGWPGRYKPVAKVILPDTLRQNKDGQDLKGSLLLIEIKPELALNSEQQWLYYFKLNPSCILITGRGETYPSYLKKFANTWQIPLFFSENAISPEEIRAALDIARTLIAKNQFDNFALNKRELEIITFQTSCGFFLNKLRHYLLNPVILLDALFRPVQEGYSEKEDTQELFKMAVKAEKNENTKKFNWTGRESKIFHKTKGEIKYYIYQLAHENKNYGYLLVLDLRGHLNDLDISYIKKTARLCLQVLLNRRYAQEIEDKYKDQFLYDLLYNNFETEEVIFKKAKQWRWDFAVRQSLFVIEPDIAPNNIHKYDILKQTQLLATNWLNKFFSQVISTEQYNQIVLIISSPRQNEALSANNKYWQKLMSDLQTYLSQTMPTLSFSIGIGRTYPDILDICRSYQEAKQALELGRFVKPSGNISNFENLGIMRLLAHISVDKLDDYYKEYIDSLINYDEENDSNFMEILHAYFKHNMNLNMTAQYLFMHPNTLRYRLKKIEELLEVDMQNWEDKLNLAIVCKIGSMLKNQSKGMF